MNRFRMISYLIALGAMLVSPALAQLPVSPSDRRGLEGSNSTSFPLGRFNARLQTLHADLGNAALTIGGHAYRRDAQTVRGQIGAFRAQMEVRLSMSPRTPATASRTFAQNEGRPTIVLPKSWISFPATNRPGKAPAPTFELKIPYLTTFAYPQGGGTLCVDVTMFSNQRGTTSDRNFLPLQDAHQVLGDGSNVQPGYRFGSGCKAPGARTAAFATFILRRRKGRLDLTVTSRFGMPSNASGTARSVVIFGFAEIQTPWPLRPSCIQRARIDALAVLKTPDDAKGHTSGIFSSASIPPPGLRLVTQVVSVHPVMGTTLSDGSRLVVPPPGPTKVTVVRIAHATDRTSTTGTVSSIVPVMQFQ